MHNSRMTSSPIGAALPHSGPFPVLGSTSAGGTGASASSALQMAHCRTASRTPANRSSSGSGESTSDRANS